MLGLGAALEPDKGVLPLAEILGVEAATVDGKQLSDRTNQDLLRSGAASNADSDLARRNVKNRAGYGWPGWFRITAIWHRKNAARCCGRARKSQQG
jgi:hypothetical protein